ncbi:glycosyltransferase family 9 protein [Arsenicibacter rosenii]|uniref:glycosyltransferase family 9 protein n=1 Tax=Arsenicibacter rosenii TaxID=1750698 RepID=UPI0015A66FC0|nr:glycosyltransferase family 9 protein [Arsenicibacter rosenii]
MLLLTSGHLGDALTLSYLFPFIKEQLPGCVIDVVAGSWCDPILINNPYIRKIIHLNHALTNRSRKSSPAKWQEHIRTTRSAIRELQKESYTVSIDIRFSSAPMHFLLPFIQVGKTIGFGSRGLGGWLDHEYFLPDTEFHHLDVITALLKPASVNVNLSSIKPYFSFPEKARETLAGKLGPETQPAKRIALICPESGSPGHFLPDAFWLELARRILSETDCRLIVCGQLAATKELAAKMQAEMPLYATDILDTVNTLTLYELAALASKAAVAVTIDSLPAHLCSALCPTVSYFNHGEGVQFFPINGHPVLLFHNHEKSRYVDFVRKDFTRSYVTAFDDTVINDSMTWIRQIVAEDVKH